VDPLVVVVPVAPLPADVVTPVVVGSVTVDVPGVVVVSLPPPAHEARSKIQIQRMLHSRCTLPLF
jgi:hypothetical protein